MLHKYPPTKRSVSFSSHRNFQAVLATNSVIKLFDTNKNTPPHMSREDLSSMLEQKLLPNSNLVLLLFGYGSVQSTIICFLSLTLTETTNWPASAAPLSAESAEFEQQINLALRDEEKKKEIFGL